MHAATYLAAMLCVVGSTSVGLDSIGHEIARTWQADSPARALRVRCRFDLKVEKPDESLADRYFPNALMPVGNGPRPRHVGRPQTQWIEDVATRGEKYRNDHEFLLPGSGQVPKGWKAHKFFNGTNSWRFDGAKRATQYLGSSPVTRLTMGYYQDMIGFPGKPLEKDRTMAGDTSEPYQLDQLIPSGKYAVEREESVNGLDCVVVSRPGLDRLWLAKRMGWAIVRREWCWSVGGPLKRRVIGGDFREVSPGVWIPYEATMEIYGHPATRPNQRVGLLRVAVLDAEADVPEDWFEPHFPKGTMVLESETGARYPFGMEMEALDQAVARASGFGPMFYPMPWWRRPVFWCRGGAILLLAAGICRYWMVRRGVDVQ